MPTFIRPASPDDLLVLARLETAADARFRELFGPRTWPASPEVSERDGHPGFILIAAEEPDGAAVGFAHVLLGDGRAHLEQLSVLPAAGRRGHGRALLDAAIERARDSGAHALTLRTYADVPWNGPFYSRAGFVERTPPDTDFHRGLTRVESELALDRLGRRAHMELDLQPTTGDLQMDLDAFEKLVIDELDRLPDEMVEGLENVVFVVEDHPENGDDLFGLYDGLAVTERGQYGMGELPDRIVVYRRAHLAACADEAQLRDEVHTTLVHEIAHYYGIDDEQLHEMGWA